MQAFSVALLQGCRALLAAQNQEATVGSVMADIDAQLAQTYPGAPSPQQVETFHCPSCGEGTLKVCAQATAAAGTPVWVCSLRCGYSSLGGQVWLR